MREIVFLLCVIFLSLGSVSALSSTLGETYEPSETMIGQLSDDVLVIDSADARVLRNGHIDVGFNGDIKKLGESYFVWLLAPLNPGDYMLVVEDVITTGGDVLNLEHNFVVEGEQTDYSLSKGVVVSSKDFEIVVTLHDDFSQTINLDYPSAREIELTPGSNSISVEFGEVIGNNLVMVNLGKYVVPAFLIGGPSICGDGEINGEEICDGSNLNSESCTTQGFDLGALDCSSNCLSFDASSCEMNPVCGPDNLELCESESECSSSGGYWYGGYSDKCNKYAQDAKCDSEHVGLCRTSGTCLDAGGYWYGSECNEGEEKICEPGDLDFCESIGDCLRAEGFWYNGGCNEEDDEYFTPFFEFSDAVIRSSILASKSPPSYSFELRNIGENRIRSIYLDYNREKFIVFPDEDIDLDPEESANVTLSLMEGVEFPVKGAVIAYAGNVSEFILVEIDSTTNEDEVETVYLEDEEGPGYYCSELGGVICVGGEVCSESPVESIGGECCLAECETGSGGSKAWIGYLIAAIIILVLLIVYIKYKKTGKPPAVPTEKRFEMAEKKLP